MTYAPIFLAVPLSGSEPQARHRAWTQQQQQQHLSESSVVHMVIVALLSHGR
jgi:hypothetical protein